MNPYEVLNLDPKSTIEDVNRAYFYIAKIYHPNKGGNEEEFLKFQQAYKTIIETHANGRRVAPKDYTQLRSAQPVDIDHQYRPKDFESNVQNKFSQELFNRRFREQRDIGDGEYTYNLDNIDNTDRREDEYKREYAQVTNDIENIIPFANGRFNNATFNHAFVHLKKQGKLERGEVNDIESPSPISSRELATCTNLEDPKNPGTGDYSDFNKVYQSNHQNPDIYNNEFLSQFQGQPDITKINSLNNKEVRKRMSDRQNTRLNYNTDRLITDLTVPLQELDGIDSEKAKIQLHRQRELLHNQSKDMSMYERMNALRAPINLKESIRGRPPPIQKKRKRRPKESNVEDELRQMRRDIRRQEKVIKKLKMLSNA